MKNVEAENRSETNPLKTLQDMHDGVTQVTRTLLMFPHLSGQSIIEEQMAQDVIQMFDDALQGYQLTRRIDNSGPVSTKFLSGTYIAPTLTEILSYFSKRTLLTPKDTHRYLIPFSHSVATFGFLAQKHSIAFFDLLIPRDNNQLGELEYLTSNWDIPLDAEGIWENLVKMRNISEDALTSSSSRQSLLKVGHWFAAGGHLLHQSTNVHLL